MQALCEVDEALDIPINIEEILYRVALEALNNSLKHAGADEIRVQLKITEAEITLNVSDNGCGFDIAEGQEGMGLGIMQERVQQIGGEIEFRSHLGKGTVIHVVV